ncbi:CHAT domain-containing protein [Embleya sp. NPDC059237]|uniref:CHAT domain-containing protein n=1 Tax=Embleya sp. NPDC059237 TaxID=3346784 RepID=UPI003691C8A5
MERAQHTERAARVEHIDTDADTETRRAWDRGERGLLRCMEALADDAAHRTLPGASEATGGPDPVDDPHTPDRRFTPGKADTDGGPGATGGAEDAAGPGAPGGPRPPRASVASGRPGSAVGSGPAPAPDTVSGPRTTPTPGTAHGTVPVHLPAPGPDGLAGSHGHALPEALTLLTEALAALPATDTRWPEFAYAAGVAYGALADHDGDADTRDQARVCFRRARGAASADAHLFRAATHVGDARIGAGPAAGEWRALLDPPPAAEIAVALRRLGADALVQLVPGAAVVSGVDGSTRLLDLPGLDYGLDLPDGDPEHLSDLLDALCAWAWDAVMAPVLAAVPGTFGRTPSLVLLPAGLFDSVPWHAAWSTVDGRRRHALQVAQISYIASPRLLCDVAARPTADPHHNRRRPIEIGHTAGAPIVFAPDRAAGSAAEHLAAGAHTVVSTLWPVAPTTAALVLYMAHHYLNRRDLPPAQALRTAQLWMRDPKRGIPTAMPAELAAQAREITPNDLTGWAAFTHSGR